MKLMQQTQNCNMNRPEVNDTFLLNDWNQNINTLDEVLAPEFEDYEPNEEGSTTIPDTTTALAGIKSKTKIADLFKNIKAFCKGYCTLGMIVDNCVTNNSNLPLAASQGKALMDLYTQLNSNVVLWSGKLTFEEDKAIILNDSISKYRYLDFYADLSGLKPITRFPSTNTYFEMQILNTPNNLTSLGLYYDEIRVNKVSNTKLQIHNDSWVELRVEGSTASITKQRSAAYIYKIVGRWV